MGERREGSACVLGVSPCMSCSFRGVSGAYLSLAVSPWQLQGHMHAQVFVLHRHGPVSEKI